MDNITFLPPSEKTPKTSELHNPSNCEQDFETLAPHLSTITCIEALRQLERCIKIRIKNAIQYKSIVTKSTTITKGSQEQIDAIFSAMCHISLPYLDHTTPINTEITIYDDPYLHHQIRIFYYIDQNDVTSRIDHINTIINLIRAFRTASTDYLNNPVDCRNFTFDFKYISGVSNFNYIRLNKHIKFKTETKKKEEKKLHKETQKLKMGKTHTRKKHIINKDALKRYEELFYNIEDVDTVSPRTRGTKRIKLKRIEQILNLKSKKNKKDNEGRYNFNINELDLNEDDLNSIKSIVSSTNDETKNSPISIGSIVSAPRSSMDSRGISDSLEKNSGNKYKDRNEFNKILKTKIKKLEKKIQKSKMNAIGRLEDELDKLAGEFANLNDNIIKTNENNIKKHKTKMKDNFGGPTLEQKIRLKNLEEILTSNTKKLEIIREKINKKNAKLVELKNTRFKILEEM
jgi:hypothetical protein